MRKANVLTKKAQEIASMTLERFVPELRPLLAAVYLSAPVEVVRMREDYADEPAVQLMLDTVGDFRKNKKMFEMFAEDGFFVEQLEYLLSVAKKDRVASARFMPVFFEALHKAEALRLPEELQERIYSQVQWQRKKDGFVIVKISRTLYIYFASDVIPT